MKVPNTLLTSSPFPVFTADLKSSKKFHNSSLGLIDDLAVLADHANRGLGQ